jgi:hypothetical protein
MQCTDDRRLRAFLRADGRPSVSLGPDLPPSGASAGASEGNDTQTALVLARRRHPYKPFAQHIQLSVN